MRKFRKSDSIHNRGRRERLLKYVRPFLNLKFVLSFGVAWMITNGWSYIALGIGLALKIKWLYSAASAYIAFLYLPFTVEKLVTIPIAIFFQTKFFPKDEKLHSQLVEMQEQAHEDWEKIKSKFRRKKK